MVPSDLKIGIWQAKEVAFLLKPLREDSKMKFKSGTRRKAVEYEKDLAKFWKENNVFEESVSQRPENNAYVFYDGPPFITGTPHHGTLLSSVVKDAIPRFWAMQGTDYQQRFLQRKN